MKKRLFVYLALAFWLSSPFYATAQRLRVGIKAGAGVAKFDYEPESPVSSSDFFQVFEGPRNSASGKYRPTYMLSGLLEYDLPQAFFLSSGIQASMKYAHFTSPSGVAKEMEINEYRFNTLYLQIPITVHYRLGKFFFGAGGYSGWAIAGTWDNKTFNDNRALQVTNGNIKFGNDEQVSNLQRFDFGARGELGYGFKQIRLSLTFDQGIANLKANNAKPNSGPIEKGTLRNQAIYATATYYWLAK